MKTRIVRRQFAGIRIPRPLLRQTGLSGKVEIRAHNGSLIIRPARKPRAGWGAALEEMNRRREDNLIDEDVPSAGQSGA